MGRPSHPLPALGSPLQGGALRRSARGVHTRTPCLLLFTRGGQPTCPHPGARACAERVRPGFSRACLRFAPSYEGATAGSVGERECHPPLSLSTSSLAPPYGGATGLLVGPHRFSAGHLGPSRYSPPPLKGGLRSECAGLPGGHHRLLCAPPLRARTSSSARRRCGRAPLPVVRPLWAGVVVAALPLRARGFAVVRPLWAGLVVLLAAPLWAVAVVFVRPLRAGAVVVAAPPLSADLFLPVAPPPRAGAPVVVAPPSVGGRLLAGRVAVVGGRLFPCCRAALLGGRYVVSGRPPPYGGG